MNGFGHDMFPTSFKAGTKVQRDVQKKKGNYSQTEVSLFMQ